MARFHVQLACVFAAVAFVATGAAFAGASPPVVSGLVASRLYVGANQPLVVTVNCDTAEELTVRLVEPVNGAVLEQASVAPGPVDLASMFPTLWTRRTPRTIYAQLFSGETPTGAPLVLQPLLPACVATDGLSGAILGAVQAGNRAAIESIFSSSASWRERLAQTVHLAPVPEPQRVSGLRAYTLNDVLLDTTAGVMRMRLRPDAAPNTAFHFLALVNGGFYDGLLFHRIVNADARGRPFIVQCGDPTGLGSGGPGFRLPFEPSSLVHDFGTVSMARAPDDPNSAGSQFFICLSREACAMLDGQYVAFAEIVEGADALLTIAASPVAPVDADNPSSPHERPMDPPLVLSARAVEAPPAGTGPGRITRQSASPIAR